MRLHNNLSALNAWRHLSGANLSMERSIERLSSGFRINRAGDDVAGLAISENMRAKIRGMQVTMKNVQDGISLIQTAEGALHEVSDLLQRGRELSLQAANGVYTQEQRQSIEVELQNILSEIDRIADTAEFNGVRLLGGANPSGSISNPKEAAMVEALRKSWLKNAEKLVEQQYGLTADGTKLKIIADLSGPNPAYVQGTADGIELHINLSMINDFTLPDGGTTGGMEADRIIAHEIAHAVMMTNMNTGALPTWFMEGTAEFIAGADERLNAAKTALGTAGVTALIAGPWGGTSNEYAAGYAAVKFLHQKSLDAGHGGIKEVLANLKAGQTMDDAIKNATNNTYATRAAFEADFQGANGQNFINSLNLADADVGAIGGGDASSVVADTITDTWDPLMHFKEVWPGVQTLQPIQLQIGDIADQNYQLPQVATNTAALGLTGVDVVNKPMNVLAQFDEAIRFVSGFRTQLGATQNRLEHTYRVTAIAVENLTASESKIRDVDMALEMTTFTRQQMLVQSSTAMLAQANALHRDSVRVLLGS